MGLGREATTYGFCKEKLDGIVVGGQEVTVVMLSRNNLSGGLSKLFLLLLKLQGFGGRHDPLTEFGG
jgi:hypothetical protein